MQRDEKTGRTFFDVDAPMLREVRTRTTEGHLDQYHEGIALPSLIGKIIQTHRPKSSMHIIQETPHPNTKTKKTHRPNT